MQKLQSNITVKENFKKNIIINTLDNTDIYLSKNSELNIVGIFKKGANNTKNFNFYLENNSKLNILIIILGTKNNKFTFTTTSHHIGKNTTSICTIKSVMFDESTVDYKGNIKIPKTGENSNSHLIHKSLLFSNKASINTLPSLEIENDKVKAGHSASIGKLDEDMMFYLQNRGLDTSSAKNLLLKGFLEEDIENFETKDFLHLIKKQLII